MYVYMDLLKCWQWTLENSGLLNRSSLAHMSVEFFTFLYTCMFWQTFNILIIREHKLWIYWLNNKPNLLRGCHQVKHLTLTSRFMVTWETYLQRHLPRIKQVPHLQFLIFTQNVFYITAVPGHIWRQICTFRVWF